MHTVNLDEINTSSSTSEITQSLWKGITVAKKRVLHRERVGTSCKEVQYNLIQPTSSNISHISIQMGNVKVNHQLYLYDYL
jgi:hypothetical protein